uniref:Maf-like protein n=1 Tax=Vannella robusta TaxID=1487602 RepID=A0A7S4MS62_9EUKA|mmetsp:Transcript_8679/g.10734  ORF Transcript_8679/g.10734 Transcript_8679/m.10734 type:complete len:217 (+) Transcript_8679:287-937(+)
MLAFANRLQDTRILLGSGSPRRQQLLGQMGLKFEVKVSGFAEDLDKKDFATAAGYVSKTSELKAKYIVESLDKPDDIDLIICADTVVVIPDEPWKILEKPSNKEEAREMIQSLSHRSHEVITAVTLVLPKLSKECKVFTETTTVYFSRLSQEEIETYISTEEPYDKAGGYGIQGTAGLFVERIDGCYYNVMGFPINRISREIYSLIQSNKLTIQQA